MNCVFRLSYVPYSSGSTLMARALLSVFHPLKRYVYTRAPYVFGSGQKMRMVLPLGVLTKVDSVIVVFAFMLEVVLERRHSK